MKRIFIIFFVFLCQFFNSCLFASQSDHVFASQAQLSIQPSSLTKSSSPLPLLITFTPSLESQESNFILTPDPDWILSNQSDSYTTSTENLPSDVLTWPGMDTALQINNGSITFPSSDLQVGVKYGFYLTGGITNNPISITNREYIWIGKTAQDNSILESVPVSIPLLNSGQITIQGQVLPRQEDLSLKLYSSHTSVNQDTIITYTLEYENLSLSSIPIRIEVDWNTPHEDNQQVSNLFDYVVGSAQKGFNNTLPTISLLERKIIWDIPLLPAKKGKQLVSFQLKTKTIPLNKPLNYWVKAQLTAPISLPEVVQIGEYRFLENVNETEDSQAQQLSNNTATEQSEKSDNSQTPIQLINNSKLSISSVNFQQIGVNTAKLLIETSMPSSLLIEYGKSPKILANQVRSEELKTQHLLTLTQLEPGQKYYFHILASAIAQPRNYPILSDLFSFQSSATNDQPSILMDEVVFSPIDSPLKLVAKPGEHPSIVLAEQLNGSLSLSVENATYVNAVDVIITSQLKRTRYELSIAMTEVRPGEFVAKLPSLPKGDYLVSASVSDLLGSFVSSELLRLAISPALKVISSGEKKAIEFAQLTFFRVHPRLNTMQLIPAGSFIAQNPVFTDSTGKLPLSLPIGSYKILASAPGYEDTEIGFVLGAETNFPTIVMKEKHNSALLARILNIPHSLQFIALSSTQPIKDLRYSQRIYELAVTSNVILFTFLSSFALAAKLQISVWQIPSYIILGLRKHLFPSNNKNRIITGRIFDAVDQQPIPKAQIFLQTDDPKKTKKILSDKQGYFFATTLNQSTIHLLVKSDGYSQIEKKLLPADHSKTLYIGLHSLDNPTRQGLRDSILIIFSSFFGMLFEIILLISIVIQLMSVGYGHPILKYLLDGVLIMNVIAWLIFQYRAWKSFHSPIITSANYHS